MFDKYLCKKFKSGKITLADIFCAVLDSAVYKEAVVICTIVLVACAMCGIAELGILTWFKTLASAFIVGFIGAIIAVFTLDKIPIASCPLKRNTENK